MSKKKLHGGARQRAGRKPVADPKQGVTIYVEQSIIDANNGVDELKSELYLFSKDKAGVFESEAEAQEHKKHLIERILKQGQDYIETHLSKHSCFTVQDIEEHKAKIKKVVKYFEGLIIFEKQVLLPINN